MIVKAGVGCCQDRSFGTGPGWRKKVVPVAQVTTATRPPVACHPRGPRSSSSGPLRTRFGAVKTWAWPVPPLVTPRKLDWELLRTVELENFTYENVGVCFPQEFSVKCVK